MIRVEAARSVGAAPETVFAFASDPGNLAKWVPGVESARDADGTWRVRFPDVEAVLQLRAVVPGALLTLEGDAGGRTVGAECALASTTEGGSRVLLACSVDGAGLLLKWRLRRGVRTALRRLADHVG